MCIFRTTFIAQWYKTIVYVTKPDRGFLFINCHQKLSFLIFISKAINFFYQVKFC